MEEDIDDHKDWTAGIAIAAADLYYTPSTTNNYKIDYSRNDIRYDIKDDHEVNIGDISLTGKQLKICIKILLEQAKNEYPEEFL